MRNFWKMQEKNAPSTMVNAVFMHEMGGITRGNLERDEKKNVRKLCDITDKNWWRNSFGASFQHLGTFSATKWVMDHVGHTNSSDFDACFRPQILAKTSTTTCMHQKQHENLGEKTLKGVAEVDTKKSRRNSVNTTAPLQPILYRPIL